MRAGPTVVSLVLSLVVAGCGDGAEQSAEPQVVPEIDLRIGGALATDSILFGDIAAACVGGDGRLRVVDGPDYVVRVIGPDGALVRRFGGRGGGPSELFSAYAAGCTDEGEFVVLDTRALAVKVFGPDGTLVTSWRISAFNGAEKQWALRVLQGRRVALGIPPTFDEGGTVQWPRPLYEIRSLDTGGVQDTILGPAWLEDECGNPSERRFQSGFREDLRSQWIPKVRWTLLPDGTLVAGCSGTRLVHLISPDGARRTVEVPEVPVPEIPAEARRSLEAVIVGERNRTPSNARAKLSLFTIPAEQPPIADILAGSRGGFWVVGAREYVPVPIPGGTALGYPEKVWLRTSRGPVFRYSASGDYEGMFTLPDNLYYRPDDPQYEPVILGDTFWAVTFDDLGIQRMARFLLRAPAEQR